jgi:uncharacterized repeat protein (TIGR03803 family)
LLKATDGKLYGMTRYGGTNVYGIIFSFDVTTNIFTDVHDFDITHGSEPFGSLIQASNGLLYGMTPHGGAFSGGVLFSFDISTNDYIDLLDFNDTNGSTPTRSLMQASNGLLFGTTNAGGINNDGVFFSFNTSNNIYTVLYNFDDGINGGNPDCDIIEIPDSLTTGINPIPNKESITIYPNPASTTLTLHSQLSILNSQLIITDILGNEVYHQAINNSTQSNINISQWSNGVYFYEINSKGSLTAIRGKFVKD